ncbi:hypothetical protein NPIL_490801 [Nephila pilipes]|uniref:Uncharacterized protein n=1 Tax=Nephila pilipes TaxID=299642 RepID=A0A8X6JTX8_NEPPI|nr:hypothetical protein NPIL_490801 [Nephila pilipes]
MRTVHHLTPFRIKRNGQEGMSPKHGLALHRYTDAEVALLFKGRTNSSSPCSWDMQMVLNISRLINSLLIRCNIEWNVLFTIVEYVMKETEEYAICIGDEQLAILEFCIWIFLN